MATITIRNIDDDVHQRIKLRAAAHNRSMEAEAREILSAAVQVRGLGAWIAATEGLRGYDLPIPPRSPSRELDLS